MSDLSVEMRDVVRRRGGVAAVDRVSLQIRRGEFFSLLGPSGSGKTSTLRLLAGFETPDTGEILIEGRPMQHIPPNLRPVNLVFQSYALFPHLTVSQNVAFGLEMRRVPEAEIVRRVGTALEMVRLSGKRDRHPSQLSGGEQQRVALARALVNRPAVLLLDEPLGALDQQLRQEMQVELKAIQEEVGITFVYVTHHQEEALMMSDRLAVMSQGRVCQVGTPREVYETPRSWFVASFIGTSNRVVGHIGRVADGRCTIEAGDLAAMGSVQARTPPWGAPGTAVILAIRPERLVLSREKPRGADENSLPVRVVKALYNGGETQYHFKLSNGTEWQARVRAGSEDGKFFAAGESAYAHWRVDDAMVLSE